MKKYFFIISILLSLAGVFAAYKAIDAVGPAMVLIAFMLSGEAIKSVSRPIDVLSNMIASLSFALVLQPATYGWPWFFFCACSLAAMPIVRILFFERIGFLKAVWYEPLVSIAVVSFYVLGNSLTPVGWMGWAFPALPVLLSLFRGLGTIMDKKTILKNTKDNFNAVIGLQAPDFSLPDQKGEQVRLSDFKGKNSVLLIFVRGDWCPSCHITLRAYERNKDKFQKNNVVVMAIGPDPIGVNSEMVKRLGLTYHLLADDKKECAYKYGVQLHENNPLTKYEVGVPLPATFLVSSAGNVAYTSRADNPGEIFFPEDIFPILEKIA